jgi:hypothetical protein
VAIPNKPTAGVLERHGSPCDTQTPQNEGDTMKQIIAQIIQMAQTLYHTLPWNRG